jgi:hypothetical protein
VHRPTSEAMVHFTDHGNSAHLWQVDLHRFMGFTLPIYIMPSDWT